MTAASVILATAPALVVLAGVMWGIASMIQTGSLQPNNWVGIRTRATRRSREAWDAAHLAAVPWLTRSAWAGGVGAVLLLALLVAGNRPWVAPVAAVLAGVAYAACLGALLWGSVLAQRAAKAV